MLRLPKQNCGWVLAGPHPVPWHSPSATHLQGAVTTLPHDPALRRRPGLPALSLALPPRQCSAQRPAGLLPCGQMASLLSLHPRTAPCHSRLTRLLLLTCHLPCAPHHWGLVLPLVSAPCLSHLPGTLPLDIPVHTTHLSLLKRHYLRDGTCPTRVKWQHLPPPPCLPMLFSVQNFCLTWPVTALSASRTSDPSAQARRLLRDAAPHLWAPGACGVETSTEDTML